MRQPPDSSGEELLRPREVAEIFGVRTSTIARWAREGRLMPLRTPGGHRRYTRSGVRDALAGHVEADAAARLIADDAARLYDQGWSIRQVAERFGCGYGLMRRILRQRVTLRSRGGARSQQP
jgi:excisionase family DNA binding protein